MYTRVVFTLRDLTPDQISALLPEQVRAHVIRLGAPGYETLFRRGRLMGGLNGYTPDTTTGAALSSTERLERMMHNAALNQNKFNLEQETGFTDLRDLEAVMIAMMHASKGVGLAAQQVGLDMQAFVMGTSMFSGLPNSRWPHYEPHLFVNPELVDVDNGQDTDWEGCLSVTNELMRPLPSGEVPYNLLLELGWRNSLQPKPQASTALSSPAGAAEPPGMVGNLYGLVSRPKRIQTRYYDAHGNTHLKAFEGRLARVWLHEYWHTRGEVYLSLVKQVRNPKLVISQSYPGPEGKGENRYVEIDVDTVMDFLGQITPVPEPSGPLVSLQR